jgi:hypothetical protein
MWQTSVVFVEASGNERQMRGIGKEHGSREVVDEDLSPWNSQPSFPRAAVCSQQANDNEPNL